MAQRKRTQGSGQVAVRGRRVVVVLQDYSNHRSAVVGSPLISAPISPQFD